MRRLRLGQFREKWCAVWLDERGQTKRRSLRLDAAVPRTLAERAFAQWKRDATQAGDSVADKMDAYLIDLDTRAARPDRPRDAWKALAPVFGHLHPSQITRDLCRAYTAQRYALGRQPGTVNKELCTLRAGLRWHQKDAWGAVFELPSPPPPRDRHLSRDEYARLKLAATAPHLYAFIVLALSTAGRARAILELTWNRVDFKRGLIQLSTGEGRKKGRATVPMTPDARDTLAGLLPGAMTDRVIEYAGQPVGSVKKAFARAVERAGLVDVSPHVLRHTAAVWMAEAGVTMPEIAAYLGHADSRITERVYVKFSPEYLRGAARALQ